jgi:type II secretion system protein C
MESREPERSIATILDLTSGAAAPYAIGDEVLASAKIISIERGRVLLERDGRVELLELGQGGAQPSAGVQRAGAKGATDPGATSVQAGVRCEVENRCVIERSLIDSLLADPGKLQREIRAVPSLQDGRLIGLRVRWVRAAGPAQRLGLRPGDELVAINGVEIASVDDFVTFYGELRRSRRLTIKIRRGGQSLDKEIEIH